MADEEQNLRMDEETRDALVEQLKAWIDAEYEGGRQTSLSVNELEAKIEALSDGALRRL